MAPRLIAICLTAVGLSISAGVASAFPGPEWQHTEEPAHRLVLTGVPQFGHINDNVWRSGQPTEEGFKRLTALGVKTIVNLRTEYEEVRKYCPPSVRYVHIPIADANPPTDAQVNEVLAIVTDKRNWPVLLHCKQGEGRVGVMTAAIRWSLDGWDKDKIDRELHSFLIARLGFIRIPLGRRERQFIHQWELKTRQGGYLESVQRDMETKRRTDEAPPGNRSQAKS